MKLYSGFFHLTFVLATFMSGAAHADDGFDFTVVNNIKECAIVRATTVTDARIKSLQRLNLETSFVPGTSFHVCCPNTDHPYAEYKIRDANKKVLNKALLNLPTDKSESIVTDGSLRDVKADNGKGKPYEIVVGCEGNQPPDPPARKGKGGECTLACRRLIQEGGVAGLCKPAVLSTAPQCKPCCY